MHGLELEVGLGACPAGGVVGGLGVEVFRHAPRQAAAGDDPAALRRVERVQRAALATLDGTACKLGRARESLLRDLLGGRIPDGVSQDELVDAFEDGIDRAQDEGHLNGAQATALRVGLKTGGLLGIVGLLLPEG